MNNDKYGFVYIWYDRKHKRFYIGCHWGREDDGYVCSSPWMKRAYVKRPKDFKRRILKTNIFDRVALYEEEQKWLNLIKKEEIKPINDKPRYYNLNLIQSNLWHKHPEQVKSIGQKISEAKLSKKLKLGPRSEEVKRKISEGNSGKVRTLEQRRKNSEAKKGNTLTEEHRAKISKGLKKAHKNNPRPKVVKRETMSLEEQGNLSSLRMKSLWNDPVWAANQKEKLKIGAKRRRINNNT